MSRSVVITAIGDGAVGKTSLLNKYVHGVSPSDIYIPTIYDSHTKTIHVDGEDVEVQLWDTAGQEGYDKLRAVAYGPTNAYLMCYALDNPASLMNCNRQWVPEVNEINKRPFVLIATKMDLISDTYHARQKGEEWRRNLGAVGFYMTSSVTGGGITEAIEGAVLAAIRNRRRCKIF